MNSLLSTAAPIISKLSHFSQETRSVTSDRFLYRNLANTGHLGEWLMTSIICGTGHFCYQKAPAAPPQSRFRCGAGLSACDLRIGWDLGGENWYHPQKMQIILDLQYLDQSQQKYFPIKLVIIFTRDSTLGPLLDRHFGLAQKAPLWECLGAPLWSTFLAHHWMLLPRRVLRIGYHHCTIQVFKSKYSKNIQYIYNNNILSYYNSLQISL